MKRPPEGGGRADRESGAEVRAPEKPCRAGGKVVQCLLDRAESWRCCRVRDPFLPRTMSMHERMAELLQNSGPLPEVPTDLPEGPSDGFPRGRVSPPQDEGRR